MIFVKLLCLAGKCNADGMIYISPQIPLNEENLATLFARPVNTIRLALVTFQKLGMIEIIEGCGIRIVNWEKHQNIKGITRARELKSLRDERYRAKQKRLLSAPSEEQIALPDPFAGCTPEVVEKWRPAFDALTATGKLPALMIEHLALVDREYSHARLAENYIEIVTEAKGVAGSVGATLPWLRKAVSALERRVEQRDTTPTTTASGERQF